jgi:1,2-diacylglycerol 3-alpha-glucosyltransferase
MPAISAEMGADDSWFTCRMRQGAGIVAASDSKHEGSAPPRVLLVCCGLDHARRGYESFARECFEALREEPRVHLELAKASGLPADREHLAWALRRDRAPAQAIGRLLRARAFRVEALSFALGLQAVIDRLHPHVVYVSEWDTARGLVAMRLIRRQKFRVLLCNGGFAAEGFEHLDHVQELTPAVLDYVVRRGADPGRHTVLPLGFALAKPSVGLSHHDRDALRKRLALPARSRIVLSVLLAGEPDDETPELRALAARRLGPDGFTMRTVPAGEVSLLQRAADVFCLASLAEMQGRAVVEAASQGMPCVVHDSPIMRYALGEHGIYGDLAVRGTLRRLLEHEGQEAPATRLARGQALQAHVYDRFSWDRLRPRYVDLLRSVASANSTVSSSTGEKLPR